MFTLHYQCDIYFLVLLHTLYCLPRPLLSLLIMILGHHRPDIIHITETNTGKLSSVLENHLVLGSIDCPLK